MKEIHGDLLNCDAQYIVHQCNSVGNHPAGLAAKLNMTFPHADIYSKRTKESVPTAKLTSHPEFPGNIVIRGNGVNERFVICALGQFYPGGVTSGMGFDCALDRAKWFKQCLDRIEAIPDMKSIAFPFQIGCGIAGGDWKKYRTMISAFARKMEKKGCEVTIINPNPAT